MRELHEPVWYAMDKPVTTDFDASIGGIDLSWSRRPCCLLAAAYGFTREVIGTDKNSYSEPFADGCFLVKLKTESNAFFKITIDLLGMRNVQKAGAMMELLVSSFWEGGPVQLSVHNKTNPNFDEGAVANDDWKEFAQKVDAIMQLQEEGDISSGDEVSSDFYRFF